jgi:prolipoprotein diacylglyceryltransferase
VLFCALIGARATYIVVNWPYFQDHLVEILQVWLGGLSWTGALAGAVLGVFVLSWLYDQAVGPLADQLIPLLSSLSVAVWLGCWLSGCAYGLAVRWGLPARDEWGIWQNRLPLQVICASLLVAYFWGIEHFWGRKRDLTSGFAAALSLAALSLILLGASFLRADPYPMAYGLRLETWAALFFFGLAIIFCLLIYIKAVFSQK